MYHCNLKIHLINCGAMDETIEKLRPLDKFSHEIITYETLNELNADTVDSNTVIIIKDNNQWKVKELKSYKQAGAIIVAVTDRLDEFMESELLMFDYIWRLPLTPNIMRYYFRKLQQDLKNAKDFWLTRNYFDTLINSLPDLVWFKRKDGIHLKVNDAFCEAVNKERSDVEGYAHGHIWGLTDEQIASGAYDCSESEDEVMAVGRTLIFHEEVLHSKRGTIQLDVYKTPIFDEHGSAIGTVGCAKDVTDELKNKDIILKMARIDALTNLTNRRYFYEYVEENRGDNLMTLCYIDLDHFKAVNDNFGHPFGDAALMGTAEVLKMAFPDELVTRLGGDEFVVTIIGDYDKEDLIARLNFLTREAAKFYAMDPAFQSLAMSIGIAVTDDVNMSIDHLLRLSDEALYYCKHYNRGGYIFYDEYKEKIAAKNSLTSE